MCGRIRGPHPARHPGGMVLWATILILQGAGFVGKRRSNGKHLNYFMREQMEKRISLLAQTAKAAKVDNGNSNLISKKCVNSYKDIYS